MGQGHPQLGNSCGGHLQWLLPCQALPSSNRECTLAALTRKIWCSYRFGDCIPQNKKLSVLPVQWKVCNSLTNFFCSKEGKQHIKANLLKQSLSVVQKVINTGKWNLTAHDWDKQHIFLFFFQISEEWAFASRPQLPPRQPAGKWSSHVFPSSARISAGPLWSLSSLFAVWSHFAQAKIRIFCC